MGPRVKTRSVKKMPAPMPITDPSRRVTATVDTQRCSGCGQCLAVCPKDTLSLVDGTAVIRGSESLNCDHCAAACPTGAITVAAVDPSLMDFRTFQADRRWLPHGRFDTAALVNLMASRRSCRSFLARPVPPPLLDDLIRAGVTAPSGSNCQPWTFTVLPDRSAVDRLGRRIGDFFRKINRTAERRWLRTGLRLIGKPELDAYYRQHYATVQRGIDAFDAGEGDLLFHGATAAVVVAARNDASCPAEDALLATGNMLLAAHALGLGTCLIGFAIEAMRRERAIVRMLGIPPEETPYAVIALGWPGDTYQRVAGRKPATVRYADLPESR